jgi:hypothetical protein
MGIGVFNNSDYLLPYAHNLEHVGLEPRSQAHAPFISDLDDGHFAGRRA